MGSSDDFEKNIATRKLVLKNLKNLFLSIDGIKSLDSCFVSGESLCFKYKPLKKEQDALSENNEFYVNANFDEIKYTGVGKLFIRIIDENVRSGSLSETFPEHVKKYITSEIQRQFPNWKYKDMDTLCVFNNVTVSSILAKYN